MPRVSLIVPVYNGERFLERMLGSILDQTWRDMECLFVDDGSTDSTGGILDAWEPRFERGGMACRVLHCNHGGQAAAVNEALPLVTGEFLTWCDGDDILFPGAIEVKACELIDHPECALVRHNSQNISEQEEPVGESELEKEPEMPSLFDGLFIGTACCYAGCYMVRMALVDQAYPTREIPLSTEGQNLQLLLPVASRGPCVTLNQVMHLRRLHSDSHSAATRTLGEKLTRCKNFLSLRRRILPHCDVDQHKYTDVAIRIFRGDCKLLGMIQ